MSETTTDPLNAPEAGAAPDGRRPDPRFASGTVLLERLPGHLALVTLNRPQARNAVDGDVALALEAIVDATEADDAIRVVVLTGAGGDAFCAGADLKEVSAGRGDLLRTERGGFAGFVFAERAKPWIAAVRGKALAGGAELMLACDLAVAADDAAFGLPEVTRGLVASAGGLFRLPRSMPARVALELVLTGEPIDARRALAFGLVNRLVPAGEVVTAALALAARVARNAPLAVRESLRIARLAPDLDTAALRELSTQAQARLRETDDFREGPLAFIEKRAPRWTGR